MKNVFVYILSIFCCLSAVNKTMAQTVASGTTGTCTWTLTGTSPNYTLTISGNGAMDGYRYAIVGSMPSPWYSYAAGISTVVIQQGVTNIGLCAFYAQYNLTSITIANSVTSIGGDAFEKCTGLTVMYVKAVNPPSFTGTNVFDDIPTTIPVHVPCGSVPAYQNTKQGNYWNRFTNYIGDIAFVINVNSANTNMGTAAVTQQPTCANSNTTTIRATPKPGYVFSQWNDGNTQNPRNITLPSDITRTAYFTTAPAATANLISVSGTTTICSGTNTSLTASASSVTNPVFRWYSSNAATSSFHTGATYPISNLTSTTTFYVSVSGDNYSENTAGNRQSVTVTVIAPLTTGGSVKPSSPQAHCPGIHPSIALGSTVQGATAYQWENSTDNRTFNSIGVTSATHNISANTLTRTTYYRRKVSNLCGGVYGDTAVISIHSLPVISAEKTTLCIGLTVRLISDNSGVWTSNNSGIVEVINGTAIEGKSDGTATLSFTSNATGCTNTLPITVNPYLNPDEITGKKVVCIGQEIELSNSMSGGVWTKNNGNISIISQTATPAKATVRGVTKGNSYVTYTVSNGECKTKRTFQLKIIPVPTTPPKIIIGVER